LLIIASLLIGIIAYQQRPVSACRSGLSRSKSCVLSGRSPDVTASAKKRSPAPLERQFRPLPGLEPNDFDISGGSLYHHSPFVLTLNIDSPSRSAGGAQCGRKLICPRAFHPRPFTAIESRHDAPIMTLALTSSFFRSAGSGEYFADTGSHTKFRSCPASYPLTIRAADKSPPMVACRRIRPPLHRTD